MRNVIQQARAARLGLILLGALFLIAGCTGPLKFAYEPPSGTSVKKTQGHPTVLISNFLDVRDLSAYPDHNPRTIGKITSMVIDMNGSTLTLNERAANVMMKALVKELKNAGFIVVSGDPAFMSSDYVLTGVLKELRFDIGPRDDLSISLFTVLTEKSTGRPIWTNTVTVKKNDYIGIWGETKGHISRYLSAALAEVARGTVEGMEEKIAARASAAQPPAAVHEASGKLSVTTDPVKAEVYVGDVYYGLSPIVLDLKPGVYAVTTKKDGFKDASRKVSVRDGQTTELDLKLAK